MEVFILHKKLNIVALVWYEIEMFKVQTHPRNKSVFH